MLLTVSIVVPKDEIFISLKEPFSKPFFASFRNLVLIPIFFHFKHAFSLSFITLWTLFNINL